MSQMKVDPAIHVCSKISIDPTKYKSTSRVSIGQDPDCLHNWEVQDLMGPIAKYNSNKTTWICSKCFGVVTYERF